MGALKNWWSEVNGKKDTSLPEEFITPSAIVAALPPTGSWPYGSTITGGSASISSGGTGSSAYYEAMAKHARIVERNTAMIKLADKLGLKSAEDVENLMKEIGLE